MEIDRGGGELENQLATSLPSKSVGFGTPGRRKGNGSAVPGWRSGSLRRAVRAEVWGCSLWVCLTAQVSDVLRWGPPGPGAMPVPSSPAGNVSLWSARGQHRTADAAGLLPAGREFPPAGGPLTLPDLSLPASPVHPPHPPPMTKPLSANSRQTLWGRLGLPCLSSR